MIADDRCCFSDGLAALVGDAPHALAAGKGEELLLMPLLLLLLLLPQPAVDAQAGVVALEAGWTGKLLPPVAFVRKPCNTRLIS